MSVLIQEIPVVDRQGETTASECSQGRTRARHRKAENGGSDCQGEEVEERYCWSQICQGKPELNDDSWFYAPFYGPSVKAVIWNGFPCYLHLTIDRVQGMQGRQGLKVIQGWLERMDYRVMILERGNWASLGSRGSLAAEARMERTDFQARMAFREIRDHQVWMGAKELLERWVKQGKLDRWEEKGFQEQKANLDWRVPRGLLARLALGEGTAIQGYWESLVTILAIKARTDHLAHMVQKGHPVSKVYPESQDLGDQQDTQEKGTGIHQHLRSPLLKNPKSPLLVPGLQDHINRRYLLPTFYQACLATRLATPKRRWMMETTGIGGDPLCHLSASPTLSSHRQFFQHLYPHPNTSSPPR